MEDKECPICFEDCTKCTATLPCGHKICSMCVANIAIKTLDMHNNNVMCPLCRATVIHVRNYNIRNLDLMDHHTEPQQSTLTRKEILQITSILMCIIFAPSFIIWILTLE